MSTGRKVAWWCGGLAAFVLLQLVLGLPYAWLKAILSDGGLLSVGMVVQLILTFLLYSVPTGLLFWLLTRLGAPRSVVWPAVMLVGLGIVIATLSSAPAALTLFLGMANYGLEGFVLGLSQAVIALLWSSMALWGSLFGALLAWLVAKARGERSLGSRGEPPAATEGQQGGG